MTQPAPKTKGAELVDRAKVYFNAEQAPSEMDLRRLRKEIEDTLRADKSDANAYSALLIAHVLDRDAAGVRAAYTRGLALAGAHPIFVKNASSAFMHTGDPAEAWNIVAGGIKRFPRDQQLLENAVTIGYPTGHIRAAARALKLLADDGAKNIPSGAAKGIGVLLPFLEAHNISDEDAASVLSPIITVMAKYTHRPGDGTQTVIIYNKASHGYDRDIIRHRSFISAENVADVLIEYADVVAASAPPEVLQLLGTDLAPDRYRLDLRAA